MVATSDYKLALSKVLLSELKAFNDMILSNTLAMQYSIQCLVRTIPVFCLTNLLAQIKLPQKKGEPGNIQTKPKRVPKKMPSASMLNGLLPCNLDLDTLWPGPNLRNNC